MFTFIRVNYEPELYLEGHGVLEDYGIYYADTNEPFITNNYRNNEGYDMSIVPVVSINRENYTIELYDFAYANILPSDRPKLIKSILELVELKNELEINNYVVTGEGAPLYRHIFNKPFI